MTSVLSLPSLPLESSDRSKRYPLLASCGLDRRVILWNIAPPSSSYSTPNISPSNRSQKRSSINPDWRNSKKLLFTESASQKGFNFDSEKRGYSEKFRDFDGPTTLEGQVLLPVNLAESNNHHSNTSTRSNGSNGDDAHRSSTGPLTTLSVSPLSSSIPGLQTYSNDSADSAITDNSDRAKCQGQQSLFLAAASAGECMCVSSTA